MVELVEAATALAVDGSEFQHIGEIGSRLETPDAYDIADSSAQHGVGSMAEVEP